MDSKELADVLTQALKTRYPEAKVSGERLDREWFTLDFTIGPDSGSVTIELNSEELVCYWCSGIDTEPSNLVPVTDGETFGVACIHNLPKLRNWRVLTEEEKKDFGKGSEDLIKLLREVQARGQNRID